MLKALGVRLDVDQLLEMAKRLADTVVYKLDCIEQSLVAQQQMLSYEYGRPVRNVAGHDPRHLPVIGRLQVVAGDSHEIDFTAALGKPATRGHITNLGDNPATLHFLSIAQQAEANLIAGPYVLMPGTTLDLSFFLDKLRVTAGSDPADVQFYVQ